MSPDISVVMSVYNGAKHLRESVDSILNQDDVDFEFIIVDDGSTDESPAVLEEYAKKDSRIRLIHQKNMGLTKALIRGCESARGQLIARQDVGDISHPSRLKREFELFQLNGQIVMSACWARMLGPHNEVLLEIRRPDNFELATDGLLHDKKGPPCHGSVMFRRDIYEKVGGYRHQFYYAQDSDLWLRLGSEGLIGYVQDFLYVETREYSNISFLRRPIQKKYAELGQLCHKARLKGESEDVFLKQAEKLRQIAYAKKKEHEEKKWKVNYFIGSCLIQRVDSRAIGYLWKAACECPINIFIWSKLCLSFLRFFILPKIPVNRTAKY